MAKRRRTNRSEKEWFRLVAEQERSGQTQKEYCRTVGITLTSFQRWRKRLQGGDAPAGTALMSGPNATRAVRRRLLLWTTMTVCCSSVFRRAPMT